MEQMHLLLEDASPVGDPQVRHVRELRAVLLQVRRAQPTRFDVFGKAALKHRIPRDLTEVHRGEVPDLFRNAIPRARMRYSYVASYIHIISRINI